MDIFCGIENVDRENPFPEEYDVEAAFDYIKGFDEKLRSLRLPQEFLWS